MSSLLNEVANKAYSLSPDERAMLAHDLIISLDEITKDNQLEMAWDTEIEKRVKEIKNGNAKGRPAEEILSEIKAKYS
ncbi:MAG: addiction module protein [Spirochaetia bacterium]|nr:addiction module protein [Spirochaetia bacterium]